MQPLPDSGIVPVPQPSSARHTGTEAELLWPVFPLDVGVQDEQGHVKVINTPSRGSSSHKAGYDLVQLRVPAADEIVRRCFEYPQSLA